MAKDSDLDLAITSAFGVRHEAEQAAKVEEAEQHRGILRDHRVYVGEPAFSIQQTGSTTGGERMLTGRHRTRRHQVLRSMAVSVAMLIGLLAFGAVRGGIGVAASTLRTIDPASLSSLPLCDGSPVRHEAVAQEEHEVTGTTLDEASSVIQFTYHMPTRVPEWVSCQVVEHVEWSDTEAQSGGVTLWLYADSYGKAPAMEVFVAPPPLKPRPLDAPLDGWDSVPIRDRQGWFQFVLPPEAPSLWTEIAWFDSDGTYYRLRGSFPLDVALEIANSISPEESSQVG